MDYLLCINEKIIEPGFTEFENWKMKVSGYIVICAEGIASALSHLLFILEKHRNDAHGGITAGATNDQNWRK